VVLMINVMPLMSDIQMVWPSVVFAALTGR
jgi:hypothetical protein